MLVDQQSTCDTLRATGMDHHTAELALQLTQQLGRETRRTGATSCEAENECDAQNTPPKPWRVTDVGDEVHGRTKEEVYEHVSRYPQWVLALVVPVYGLTAFVSTWTVK